MTMRQELCLDDERLVSALLDEHGGGGSGDVAHLRVCPTCAGRGESWSATLELAAQDARAVAPPPPADLAASIRRAVSVTAQDGQRLPRAVRHPGPSWRMRAADWARGPALWRPALIGGLLLAVVAGVWTTRPVGERARMAAVSRHQRSDLATPLPTTPAAASLAIAREPGAGRVGRNTRTGSAAASIATSREMMTPDWAAWDDSTVTEVGALAQTSLRRAVVRTVASSADGSDALSSEDAWREVSDLTPDQQAWLAAELAKKMGG